MNPFRGVRAFGVVLLLCQAAGATEYFVAPGGNDQAAGTADRPFATFQRARDAVRALKQRGPLESPVTVRLQGGTYPLTQAVQFSAADSGTAACPIRYVGAGDRPAVIDGGRAVTGWTKHDDRRWVAHLPAVAAGQWYFRQLFVQGREQPRARIPNQGYLRVAACPDGTPETTGYHVPGQRFEFKPGDIRADWTNLSDVEVVVYHFWTDAHLPIRSVDEKTHVVTFAKKSSKTFTDDFSEKGARYIVDNVFEGLDSPGEWYLNRKTGDLFYYPKPGEDPNQLQIVAPVAHDLLRLNSVQHVEFSNLTFTHNRFELPAKDSNSRQGSIAVPAAIILTASQHCRFDHCAATGLGGYAFEVKAGCRDDAFTGNEISQVAAGGFRVDGGTENNPPQDRTRDIRIEDNEIHDYGTDYPSAVGVILMNASECVVAHNAIHHGGYTGVSVGWVWGYLRSVSQNNHVEFNDIHDIGGVLSDMGGIYTLGVSPGTTIRNNRIHDVTANSYGGWGIYQDEGSTHLLVENNLVYRTMFAPYNIHYAKEVTVRNNIFAFGKLEQLSRTRMEPHKSVFLENNIVYWRTGELYSKNWKDAPYRFHASAIHPDPTLTSTFDADWNLYFNPDLKLDAVRFNGATWAEWHQRGKDEHSRYADPKFAHPDQDDFTLAPDSPALALGFRPIDLSTVGPRGKPGVALRQG